ncbi:hypothetical protein [Pelagerythrobacter marensis]|uniref:Uncharacterized protein n=1 Tax=Pelagerythrobacter marensis TaxID=543877 RepID=A0A0G3X894_9SPHN|nr:hypothetical protein [Pelagerythrobacter marensis]AKM06839.1 hypothetical protein AM2010_758 [Pelagerythrobacter marensis]
MMRRYLVLTDESARHPFRASLPPHVFRLEGHSETETARWRMSLADVRGFASAYVACVVAAIAFIV